MALKLRTTSIFAMIFYSLIFLHKYAYHYFNEDDFFIQMFYFMAISFSSAFFESAIKTNVIKIKRLGTVEFTLRVLVLVIHILFLLLDLNVVFAVTSTVLLLIANMIVYFLIKQTLKKIDIEEIPNDVPPELSPAKLKTLIQKSGSETLLFLIVVFLTPMLILSYKYQNMSLILISLIVLLVCLYFMTKLHMEVSRQINGRSAVKMYVEIISFLIGLSLIISYEVFFYQDQHLIRPTILFIGILCFLPAILFKSKLLHWQKSLIDQEENEQLNDVYFESEE